MALKLSDFQKIPNTPQPTAGMGLVLDANGQLPTGVSNYLLQLLNPGQHKVAFGGGIITFTGGSVFSGTLSVPHGLGVVPVVSFLTAAGPLPGGLTQWPNMFFPLVADSTNLNVAGQTVDGQLPINGTLMGFYWLAIS